ncbi:hypothetical protein CC86DRAFT_378317 [Ophiobolus disseminans]|uniref:Uncharacterized protein n=1 Tax=Ophiobolus disseminans TaxID=1469910 RepID=A0A6A7AE99_9PLEO|nr:hypothetical protein CC86DRAFT_378317 [Ophiobolus disseminans]
MMFPSLLATAIALSSLVACDALDGPPNRKADSASANHTSVLRQVVPDRHDWKSGMFPSPGDHGALIMSLTSSDTSSRSVPATSASTGSSKGFATHSVVSLVSSTGNSTGANTSLLASSTFNGPFYPRPLLPTLKGPSTATTNSSFEDTPSTSLAIGAVFSSMMSNGDFSRNRSGTAVPCLTASTGQPAAWNRTTASNAVACPTDTESVEYPRHGPAAKAVFLTKICPVQVDGQCEDVRVVANDCRLLTTPLGSTIGKVTVWPPARCSFFATTNCSTYFNLANPHRGLFEKVDFNSGDITGQNQTTQDMRNRSGSKLLSMMCF